MGYIAGVFFRNNVWEGRKARKERSEGSWTRKWPPFLKERLWNARHTFELFLPWAERVGSLLHPTSVGHWLWAMGWGVTSRRRWLLPRAVLQRRRAAGVANILIIWGIPAERRSSPAWSQAESQLQPQQPLRDRYYDYSIFQVRKLKHRKIMAKLSQYSNPESLVLIFRALQRKHAWEF